MSWLIFATILSVHILGRNLEPVQVLLPGVKTTIIYRHRDPVNKAFRNLPFDLLEPAGVYNLKKMKFNKLGKN